MEWIISFLSGRPRVVERDFRVVLSRTCECSVSHLNLSGLTSMGRCGLCGMHTRWHTRRWCPPSMPHADLRMSSFEITQIISIVPSTMVLYSAYKIQGGLRVLCYLGTFRTGSTAGLSYCNPGSFDYLTRQSSKDDDRYA